MRSRPRAAKQRRKQSLRRLERSRHTSAGKAPSKPPRATATATPAEPQSKQTKLLMKIRDLLKQLPRDARNDVITNQFSQKQRVLLEKFMVDNAGTSSGTKSHSEVKALAPAATSKRNAPNRAGFEIETVSKSHQSKHSRFVTWKLLRWLYLPPTAVSPWQNRPKGTRSVDAI